MADGAAPLTAAALAELVGGRVEGDGTLEIHAVSPLDRAHGAALSFLTSSRYADQFSASLAGAVLVPEGFRRPTGAGPACLIVVRDPQQAMATACEALFPDPPVVSSIDPTARLGRSVRLGRGIVIGPGAVLGDEVVLGEGTVLGAGVVLDPGVTIGERSRLDAHVVCHRRTRIGDRVIIKAGAVIGGSGFGFRSDRTGHHPIPHVGGCRIEDDVQIGSNSCIDRGSVDDTVIGAGTKIDNLVHIGHNAHLGPRCLVMGGVVVAGSARIGSDVILAGHSAVGGHFTVGDRARIAAKAGVISAVPAGADMSGFPARPHREFLRAQAALYRLPAIIDELETIVKERR